MYHSDYVLVATSALDANVSALSVYYNNIILATFIGIAHGMFPSNIFAPKNPHLFYPSFTCSTLSGPRLH